MHRTLTHFLFCMSLVIVSCKPDSDAPCRDIIIYPVEVPATFTRILPDVQADSLIFLTDTHDTLTLYSQLKQQFFNGTVRPGNPECPPDSTGYNGQSNLFNDSTGMRYSIQLKSIDSTVQLMLDSWLIHTTYSILMNDSASLAADSVTFGGNTFYEIRIFTSGNDSAYLSLRSGLVRWKHAASTFTRTVPQ
jgi:hypothetical protein